MKLYLITLYPYDFRSFGKSYVAIAYSIYEAIETAKAKYPDYHVSALELNTFSYKDRHYLATFTRIYND